jgi:thiol-disulfide isomerase/thioredoxin
LSDRALAVSLAISLALLIAANARFKHQPTADELKSHTDGIQQARDWHNRLAPDFALTMLDGSVFRLHEQVGTEVIVLNFFATWCGPCRAEMPELQRYQHANRDNGMLLIGVDAEEKASLVKSFAEKLELTFPIGIDDSGALLKKYDVTSFPTTIVVGADGRVKLRESGAILNADVALGRVIAVEAASIREQKGITPQAFLTALAAEPPRNRSAAPPANSRAARIAAAMPCPCGCADKVAACGCQTAKGIKARLDETGYEDKTDAQVMEELNKQFCMKGM